MIPVCPKCDVPLFILNFKEIEVDFCDRCRGLWLDAGELEELMTATGAIASDPFEQFANSTAIDTKPTQYLCPRCDKKLDEVAVDGQLRLDRCPRGHGLWFDEDELSHLLMLYPADSQASKTVTYLNDLFAKPETKTQGE